MTCDNEAIVQCACHAPDGRYVDYGVMFAQMGLQTGYATALALTPAAN
jgi:hypothetical protein